MAKINKQKKKKSALEVILNVLLWIIIVAVLFVDAVAIVSKLRGDDTFNFFGYRAYLVNNSPSMSEIHPSNMHYLANRQDEQFGANDLIFIKPVEDSSQLSIYTVVAYKNSNGKTVVHRIIDKTEYVNQQGQVVRMYTCRGDANNANDPYLVDERQIIGIYWTTWGSGFATVIRFVQSIYGVIAVAGCLFIYFFAAFWLEVLADKQRKEKAVWDDWNQRYQSQLDWSAPNLSVSANGSIVQDKHNRKIYLGVMPPPPPFNPNGNNNLTPPYQVEDPTVLLAKTPEERLRAQKRVDRLNKRKAKKSAQKTTKQVQQAPVEVIQTTLYPYPQLPPNAVDLQKEMYNN